MTSNCVAFPLRRGQPRNYYGSKEVFDAHASESRHFPSRSNCADRPAVPLPSVRHSHEMLSGIVLVLWRHSTWCAIKITNRGKWFDTVHSVIFVKSLL